MNRLSQKAKILAYMRSGKKITPAIAYEKFGCLRLSERILVFWFLISGVVSGMAFAFPFED